MKIVYIGWGSLINDSDGLELQSDWHKDGAILPVEFARHSADGRITLVLDDSFTSVPTLWAETNIDDKNTAIEALRVREGNTRRSWIHSINKEDNPDTEIEKTVHLWLISKGYDCAIWTGIPPKFNSENGYIPSIDELTNYIEENIANELICEYILTTPQQVQTKYRPKLEAILKNKK